MTKMTKLFLQLCLATLSLQLQTMSSVAQTPSFVWADAVTSSNYGVGGSSIALDAAGNTYIAGTFLGTVDFDPGAATYNISSYSNCCDDIFILKLNVAGNFVWAKQIGGTNFDRGKTLCIDDRGNVYYSGTFGGVADFDPGIGTYTLTTVGSGGNMFVSKLDANGNFVWVKQFVGKGIVTEINSIAVDASGNVYTTGIFNDTCDFDPASAVYNLIGDTTTTFYGENDHGTIYISKLDASGNFVWAKQMGDNLAYNESNSIHIDASGNIYATGAFGGTGDFDPGPGTFNLTCTPGINNQNIFISKLDAFGNFVFAKQLGNGSATALGYGIKTDQAGNVYSVGSFYNTGDFDPGAGTFNLTSVGVTDIFISELDASGNFLWAKRIGASGRDAAYSLTVDQYKNVYTTGLFNGTVDFDPGAETFTVSSGGSSENAFVSKLDASGNFINTGTMNGGSSGGLGIAADNLGNTYTTGSFGSVTDFDPGAGTYTLSGTANSSMFISKLCTSPAPPTNITNSNKLTICSGMSTTLTVTSAGTVNWYSTPTSTIVLGTGANFVTSTLTAGIYTYYAEANACSINATRSPITLTVNPAPLAPTASNKAICSGSKAMLSAIGSGTLGWYSQATGGTYLGGGANYTTPILTTNTTYYVQDSTCTPSATRKAVLVTVNPLPTVTANASATNICAGTTVTLTGGGATYYTWTGGVTNGVGFIPSNTATFTVTGTDGNNCSNTATKTIHVNPLPIVTAIASATNVCEGTIVTLTGGGAASYTWSDGITNGVAFVTSTTSTYTVTGTDGNNCSNTATKTINVTPQLDLTTSLSGLTISANQTGAIYQWLNCNNGNSVIADATSQSYTASINGNYAVIVKMNSCSDTSTCVNVSITGIEKTTEDNIQLKVFPNPGNGSITIQSINEGMYTIKNESGQTIQTFKLNTSNNYTINIENLSNGIYFIVGLNGNQMINQKVVIAK